MSLVGGIADIGSSWHHCMNNCFLDNILYCTCGINQPSPCRLVSNLPFLWFCLLSLSSRHPDPPCLTTFSPSSPNVPQGWEGPSWRSGDPEQPEWPHGDPQHLPAAEEPGRARQKPVQEIYSSNQWVKKQWHVHHTFQCLYAILVLE